MLHGLKIVSLFFLACVICSNTELHGDDFIDIDGILVRKSDVLKTKYEQQQRRDETGNKARMEEQEALLYRNETRESTKHLPSQCQVCRLMVTEMERKLRQFGKQKETTKEGRPLFYKDQMVMWHVFDDLCEEMKKYNIDKKTPFRYRKGARSYLRRMAENMTSHGKITHWVWNLEDIDIDDPTREMRRLTKNCERMVIKHQDVIRKWFYTSQDRNPLTWLCGERILRSVQHSPGCLWIKDENLDQLIQLDNEERKVETDQHDEL